MRYAAVARYSSNQSHFASMSAREARPSLNQYRHRWRRQAPNMSAKVGSGLLVYQGRCLLACSPLCPAVTYHRTTKEPMNQDIGAALDRLRAPHLGIVKTQHLLAVTKGHFHRPAAAIARDDLLGREGLVGRKQGFVPPLAFGIANQNQLHRLRTGGLIPADILDHLHL